MARARTGRSQGRHLTALPLLAWLTGFLTCLSYGLLLECPLHQMHFQKIIGFRPPLEYISERNLIYAPENNYKDRNRSTTKGVSYFDQHADVTHTPSMPSTACWEACNADDDCIAYVHLLDSDRCYGYSYFERVTRYEKIANDLPLVADAEAIFYEKTCLKVPSTCKNRIWPLTKIPGSSLVLRGRKTVPTLVTRRECAERCLFESDFKCLSASFAPSYRNNRERFSKQAPMKQHAALGRCQLSDKDKMMQPDAFRVAPYDEEYLENQCYERQQEHDHCSYELYSNSTFIYAEAKYDGLTQKECQARCTQETNFYCQGVSFFFEHDLTTSECLLHSEDIISMGPRSLKLRENSIYMRRVKCLDVQVICTHNEMVIKYTPSDIFLGKMYVSLHSQDCMTIGNGNQSALLRLMIGSEAKENRCGIIRAYEVTNKFQRTFISTLVVIQNNANVQTQGDRLIKVGCIMTNEIPNNNQIDGEEGGEGPNAIALESPLQFSQSVPSNIGTFHLNTSNSRLLPKFTLQVIDLSHQHETNDVQIGQNLELQIVAEYTPQQQAETIVLPPLPDFRATSLVAKTQDDQNYILLIDKEGCPTDDKVFPAFDRVRTHSKSMLRARFHAFKFAGGSSSVNFDVKIHYCPQRCPPTNCLQLQKTNADLKRDSNSTTAGRQRRQQPQLKVQNPVYISTVVDVADAEQQLNQTAALQLQPTFRSSDEDTLPLNYNLHVHGPTSPSSNSVIYGERGVLLIAGIDNQLQMDSICLNQSLLIAVLIFWLIFQVVLLFGCCYAIQKYKRLAAMDEERRKIQESFDYMDPRRVHWADQGGFTL